MLDEVMAGVGPVSVLESFDEQADAIERRLNAARSARNAFDRHLTDGTVILTEGQDK